MQSRFLFATCNAGSESALKAEMKSRHGGTLTPAFMRPGLVTWKVLDGHPEAPRGPPPVFAHVTGDSLGMAKDDEDIPPLASSLGAGSLCLHVFPRVLPDDGLTAEHLRSLDKRRAGIASVLAAAGVEIAASDTPRGGDTVLDVILGEGAEPAFIGTHVHDRWHHRSAGALSRALLPPGAPSRAWLKMEQALDFLGLSGPASLCGRTVMELGSAPGGASLALLQHGAKVFGVDTGRMDAGVLNYSGARGTAFVHIAASAGDLARIPLPCDVDILVSDMNLAPPVALRYIERIQKRARARELILTLKINDREMEAGIAGFLERLRSFAPGEVRASQLPANRKEITVFAG